MPTPAMRLRILPRFPARVQASGPVEVTRTAGTYTFALDYLDLGADALPGLTKYVAVQDANGVFSKVLLSDLPTGKTDWSNLQNRPAKIDGFTALASTLGAVEQTGTSTYAIRPIGDASASSLVTFSQISGLYQPLNTRLSSISTSGGVATADIINDAVTFAKTQNIATQRLLGRSTASSGDIEELTVGAGLTLSGGQLSSSATAATGSVINSTYAEYTTSATLSTAIPFDDTIPQNTEGTQILSASITPSSTSNKVRVKFQAFGGNSAGIVSILAAMFRGATANAIAASAATTGGAGFATPSTLEIEDSPATTSATTYTVRVGPVSGSLGLNGFESARRFGGVARATLILEEIKG